MSAYHTPVLLEESITALAIREDGRRLAARQARETKPDVALARRVLTAGIVRLRLRKDPRALLNGGRSETLETVRKDAAARVEHERFRDFEQILEPGAYPFD